MIQAIDKKYCTSSHAQLLTQYDSNSIIIDSKEILFLSNKDVMIHKRLEDTKELKLSGSDFEKNDRRAKIRYQYGEPHLQIICNKGKLSVRSLCFVNATKCVFYSSAEDNEKGAQHSVVMSKDKIEDIFQYQTDLDSFYILDNKGKLLTAINMIDGVVKNKFDINQAVRSRKNRKMNGYSHIMIKTKDGKIEAKYFSLKEHNHKEIEVHTRDIPIVEINIYDVIKEASKHKIPYKQYPELSLKEYVEESDKEKEKSHFMNYYMEESVSKDNHSKQKQFRSILKRKSKN